MELDDFKEDWKNAVKAPFEKEGLQKKIDDLGKSGKSIRKMFVLEISIVVCIYLLFFAVVFFSAGKVEMFMYKLVVVIFFGSMPISYRLYKSQKWINSIDYSKDIKSNLTSFRRYYKKTLTIYRWTSYLLCFFLFIVLFTDSSFNALSLGLKTAVICYIIVVMLLSGPYITKVYGRRIKSIESFLEM